MRTILPARFNHLEESFPYEEVQFKTFCLPVKTGCPPVENVDEIPAVCMPTTSSSSTLSTSTVYLCYGTLGQWNECIVPVYKITFKLKEEV